MYVAIRCHPWLPEITSFFLTNGLVLWNKSQTVKKLVFANKNPANKLAELNILGITTNRLLSNLISFYNFSKAKKKWNRLTRNWQQLIEKVLLKISLYFARLSCIEFRNSSCQALIYWSRLLNLYIRRKNFRGTKYQNTNTCVSSNLDQPEWVAKLTTVVLHVRISILVWSREKHNDQKISTALDKRRLDRTRWANLLSVSKG